MEHTAESLKQKQSLPLDAKVVMTQDRLREWVEHYGEGNVYISFSGGKDSTVLMDIARKMYPNIKAVFMDTGLEFPQIRDFVKTYDNVDWLKPKMTFRKVIETYGYPFISKDVSDRVYYARRYLDARGQEREREKREKESSETGHTKRSQELEDIARESGRADLRMLTGTYPSNVPGDRSRFNMERWQFLLDAPFKMSKKCCDIMKKGPVHSYSKETGRYGITAQIAAESQLRYMNWLKYGCNGFGMKRPISNPMAFWTEQDILQYIVENNLPICSVYGNIVQNKKGNLETTGCDRTGCMFCGYGCHLEKKGRGRFELMKETNPVQYDYIMRPWDEGGLGYKEVIDWINEHGGTHIRY